MKETAGETKNRLSGAIYAGFQPGVKGLSGNCPPEHQTGAQRQGRNDKSYAEHQFCDLAGGETCERVTVDHQRPAPTQAIVAITATNPRRG